MPDTTARIRAKGLDATGVTEDLAQKMHAHKGKHYMAIVEWRVEEVHEKADGTAKVDLVLTQVEPATDQRLDDHLRELTRTLHYNRGLDDAQPTLSDDGGPDPKLEDVLRDGQALVERDDDGNPVGLWPGDDPDAEPGAHDDEPMQLHDDGPAYDGDEGQPAAARATNVLTRPFGDGQDAS